MGVYPRELEELEGRVEASGWQLSLGEDSDQVGRTTGGQDDRKKEGQEEGRT